MKFLFLCLIAAATLSFQETPPEQTAQSALTNPGFEQGDLGSVPTGWEILRGGFAAEISNTNPHNGEKCASLYRLEGNRSEVGGLGQTLDATPFRGKVIRLRAAVRVDAEKPGQKAQLRLLVRRMEKLPGFLDDMANRPIRDPLWNVYEISGGVHDDADKIEISLLIFEGAKAWIDEIQIEMIGDFDAKGSGPKTLEDRELQNLIAFAKLYGLVCYFHPSDESASVSWVRTVLDGVEVVADAKNAEELKDRLTRLFAPIAPTMLLYTGDQKPEWKPFLPPSEAQDIKLTWWVHHGVQGNVVIPEPNQKLTFFSERVQKDVPGGKIPQDAPDPNQPYQASLGGGVSVMLPIALFRDSTSTLPVAKPTQPEEYFEAQKKYRFPSGNDRTTRLTDVMMVWNVYQYFFPFWEEVKADWDATLAETLKAASEDRNEEEFLFTLRKMLLPLKDGESWVFGSTGTASYFFPFHFTLLGNALVVDYLPTYETIDLSVGDTVLEINGKKVADLVKQYQAYLPVPTPGAQKDAVLFHLLSGEKDAKTELKVKDVKNKTKTVTVSPTKRWSEVRDTTLEELEKFKDGSWYVDLRRIEKGAWEQSLEDLAAAKAVIFDLRGVPRRIGREILGHLTDVPIQGFKAKLPIVTHPDRDKRRWEESESTIDPKTPRFAGKIAFLIDERTQGPAEAWASRIEHHKLGVLVGSATGGNCGEVNQFNFPGGINVNFTGSQFVRPGGGVIMGAGIQPAVKVSRTLKGIQQGKDEVLEKAQKTIVR